MPTTNEPDFGVLQSMPIESFVAPPDGLSEAEEVERKLRLLLEEKPPAPPTAFGWPRIRAAIQRNGLFVIETETPAFTAMLRFYPQQPDKGDYEIHHRPHGRTEKGRTEKVVSVTEDSGDSRLSTLAPFATRYAVVTVGAARSHARMVWLVGLSSFQVVDEKELPDETVV